MNYYKSHLTNKAKQRPYQAKYENYIDYCDRIDIVKKVLEKPAYMHWHEFCELEFIFEGDGIQITKDQVLPYKKGVIFLLLPTDFHEVVVDSNSPPELYSVKFAETFIDSELYKTILNDGKGTRQIMLEGEEFESTKRDFKMLYTEFCSQSVLRSCLLRCLLEKIIIMLERNVINSENHVETLRRIECIHESTPTQQILTKCLSYIQNNYAEDITLTEMAEMAHLSPNYFSDFFHRNTGSTFRDYLKNVRLRFSVSLLINSQIPIYEIGDMVGFNSYEHFERLFRRVMGVSPGAFRKKINKKREESSNNVLVQSVK